MTRARVSVVKVGGSLLDSPELPRRLRAWLAAETAAQHDTHVVLIAGGGKWVDAIRHLDAHTPLGDERAHWICIALMDVTAGLIGAMLPELCTTSSLAEVESRLLVPGVTLLRPGEFVRECEPTLAGTRLPANWSVSSDSIAGRLAIVLGADEVVLLKSAPPPTTPNGHDWLAGLAAARYVDAFLPTLRDELPGQRFETLPPQQPMS
ncbi:MAG: hypothetical protein WD971_10520 [Pirellulales bacterium]